VSTTYLLDANVLIAAVAAEHEHHNRVTRWLSEVRQIAVCPVVESAFRPSWFRPESCRPRARSPDRLL